MRIVYNGIDLGVISLEEFRSEAVYDDTGTDYLYTRHTVTATAQVNGQAELTSGPRLDGHLNGPPISYQRSSGTTTWSGVVSGAIPPGVTPGTITPLPVGEGYVGAPVVPAPTSLSDFGATPGDDGIQATNLNKTAVLTFQTNATPLTYAQIYRRLTTPGGMLWVFSGPGVTDGVPGANNVMLQSPAWGSRVDCTNGPKPKVLAITAVHGDATTFQVVFSVETTTNDTVGDATFQPTVLLSNRFRQIHHLGDDSFLTVMTEGTAIFRTDWVYAGIKGGGLGATAGFNPDALRGYLFQPIVLGFVREDVVVEGLADVTGVRYSYTDRQQPANFVAGPYIRAASITAYHRQAVTNGGDVLGGVLGAYERILGMRANKEIGRGSAGQKKPVVPSALAQSLTLANKPPKP